MDKKCRVCDRIKTPYNGRVIEWQWKRFLSDGTEVNEQLNLCGLLFNFELKEGRDNWSWIGAADKNFSVGVVKDRLNNNIAVSGSYVLDWCKWLPLKCNVFIWRADLNRIATLEPLKKRNIGGPEVSCLLCDDADETMEHLFCSCVVASVLGAHVSSWCKFPNFAISSFRDLHFHEHVGLKGQQKEALKGIVRIGFWSIWRARNGVKFNNKPLKIENIISETKSMGFCGTNADLKTRILVGRIGVNL